MRVSVIIPAYNAGKFLHKTIDSVLEQQTDFPFEVVVVNDGSTDNTSEVLAAYGDTIRVIEQANQGVSIARNTGIEAARGELIAILDSDDYWKPGKLQAQVDFFDAHPDNNIGIVDTFTEIVNHKGKVIYVLDREKHGYSFSLFLKSHPINQPSSIMFPKAVFEDIGGFDPELNGVEDYDFSLRVSHKYEIFTVPEVYCVWVHHDDNATTNVDSQYVQSMKLKEKIRRLYPEDIDERGYRHLVARSQAYFIPWFFRAGRYGKVLSLAASMLRKDPGKIRHRSMLFVLLALLGPLGKRIHKTVARDTRG